MIYIDAFDATFSIPNQRMCDYAARVKAKK